MMKGEDICPICGAKTFESDSMVVVTDRKDYMVLVHNVPGRICHRCGEQVCSFGVAEKIDQLADEATKKVIRSYKVDVDFRAA